jgi:hypothetical protein
MSRHLTLLLLLAAQWLFSGGVLATHHGNHINHVHGFDRQAADVAGMVLKGRQDPVRPLLRLSKWFCSWLWKA